MLFKNKTGAVGFCHRLILIQMIILTCGSAYASAPLCSRVFKDLPQGLPSDVLRNSSPANQKFWKNYEQITAVRLKYYLGKSADKYLAAKEKNHPHIQFLERMGFDLLKQRAPSIMEMMDKIETEVLQQVESKVIPAEDTLLPLMTVRMKYYGPPLLKIDADVEKWVTPNYTWENLRYGGEPRTVGPWNISLRKATAFQRYRDFAQMLSNGGFPISTTESANGESRGDWISALQHDLGHIDTMTAYPKFAAATRKHYTLALTENKTADDGLKYITREFLAFESSFIIGPNTSALLEQFLSLPKGILSRPEYKKELEEYFNKKSPDELKKLAEFIQFNEYRLFIPIGAALRDIISHNEFEDTYQFPSKAALSNLEETFANGQADHRQKAEALARLTIFAYAFQKLTPESWVHSIIEKEGQKSPLVTAFEIFDKSFPKALETRMFWDFYN